MKVQIISFHIIYRPMYTVFGTYHSTSSEGSNNQLSYYIIASAQGILYLSHRRAVKVQMHVFDITCIYRLAIARDFGTHCLDKLHRLHMLKLSQCSRV